MSTTRFPATRVSSLVSCGILALSAASIPAAAQGTVRSELEITEGIGGFSGDLDGLDTFGIDMAGLGDLDGDGIEDLAVGSRLDDDGGADQGAVWILFLNADGTVKAQQKISETEGGLVGPLNAGEALGRSLDLIGDLDDDGNTDLVVGTAAVGRVWVLFLNADGTVKGENAISLGGQAGVAVCGLGDVDGDGVEDVAVGDHLDDDGAANAGAVWVLFLNTDGTVKAQQKISAAAGGFGGSLSGGDQFGSSLGGLEDLDGDGRRELAVGAYADDDGGVDQGAVWILFLNADGTVQAEQKISALEGGFTGELGPSDLFGHGISSTGDLDADGTGDVAVGAFQDDDGVSNAGALWLLFLNPDGTVKAHQKISATQGGFEGSLQAGDRFGVGTSCLGDLDGDGVIELAVGADLDDGGAADGGAVWILFLSRNWSIAEPLPVDPMTMAPHPRGALVAETIDGKLHVLGGDATWNSGAMTSRHDVYDPVAGTWTSAAAVPDTNTWGAVSAFLDGKLYLMGGFPSNSNHHVYDPDMDTWLPEIAASGIFRGDAVALNGFLYWVGCFNGTCASGPLKRYDPGLDMWTTLASVPTMNAGIRMEAIGGRIYAVGVGNLLQIYDPGTDTWSSGAGLPGGATVYAPTTAVLGGMLYVFGGSTGGNGNGPGVNDLVWVYDPASDTWSPSDSMPTPRYWSAAAVVGNRAHVLGGFDSSNNAVDAHEVWLDESATQLLFPSGLGFAGVDGVEPNKGMPGRTFQFQVEYRDVGGLLPGAGFPKLRIDEDGDGNADQEHVMLAADGDADVTDGKTYFYSLELPDPAPDTYRYSFVAENSTGEVASGAPTAWIEGPDVREDLYDLSIFASDILFSKQNPLEGETFTVTARLENESLLGVDDVEVQVFVEGDLTPIHTDTVAHLDPGGTGEVSFPWAFAQEGFYPLRVRIDTDMQYEEYNELNNDAVRPIVVGEYTLPGAIDVVGLPMQVTYTVGGYVGFSGTATYDGTALDPAPKVQGATVTFRPSWSGAFTTTTNDAGSFARSFPAPVISGTWTVEIEVTDYTLTSTHEVTLVPPPAPPPPLPNLRMTLTVDETRPCEGDTVQLTATVTNVGGLATTAMTVARLEELGVPLVPDETIPVLAVNASHSFSHLVPATSMGTRYFTARVDPANVITELIEVDNQASAGFTTYQNCFEWDPDYVRVTGSLCEGDPVGMSFLVRNNGCDATPATQVRVTIPGFADELVPLASIPGKGGVLAFGYQKTFASAASYPVTFTVLTASGECVDTNNSIGATVVVQACPGTLDFHVDACDLSASVDAPTSGQPVTFRADVTNTGTLDGAPVVRFFLDGVPFGADLMPTILAGQTVQVESTISWNVDLLSPHDLRVEVDPDGDVAESSEFNNVATRRMPYDLRPVALPTCPGHGASIFSTCGPCNGDTVTVRCRVINTGLFTKTDPVVVTFFDGFTSSSFMASTTGSVGARGECTGATSDATVVPMLVTGTHPFTLTVDSDGAWPEYDETNNTLTRSVTVSSCLPVPDLTLLSEHINPSFLNPDPGQMVDVAVTIFNEGLGTPLSDVLVDVYVDGQLLSGGLNFGPLAAGTNSTLPVPVQWTAPAEAPYLHVIQAVIDPSDVIAETSESNNAATRSLIVDDAPDLFVRARDIFRLPGATTDSYTAVIQVSNQGEVAGSALLEVSVVADDGTVSLIDQIPVSLPAAGMFPATLQVQATWQSSAPSQRVRATLTGATPGDFDATNDSAERVLGGQPRNRGKF